jgi:hypothetical protein
VGVPPVGVPLVPLVPLELDCPLEEFPPPLHAAIAREIKAVNRRSANPHRNRLKDRATGNRM